MKQTEFLRKLRDEGVRIENATKHYKAYFNGKQTTIPRHPGKEISNDFAKVIRGQLGMK